MYTEMIQQLMKPFSACSTSLWDSFLAVLRIDLQIAQEARGWIWFTLMTTSIHHPMIAKDVLLVEVILGWHNSSCWLLDNSDDDDCKKPKEV